MKFTETHEWIEQNRKFWTVGITQYAKNEIGEVVYVELPKVGAFVKRSDDACVVESTKAAIVIPSPVSGKIVEVNDALRGTIKLINEQPEKEGWLYRIEATEPREFDSLLTREDYQELINKA